MARTRFLNLLLLAALVFAVFRLWLFLGEPPPALPVITGAATSPADTGKPEPPAEAVEPRPEGYDGIVARDLFSPTRGVVPPAPTAAIKPAAKPQPAAPPKLTLAGVVIIDGEKIAYVQEGSQEARPRKVKENESFAGFVVKAIRPDGITVMFSGNEINVPLRVPRDTPEAPAPRSQSVASPAPRPETPTAFPRRQLPTGIQQGQMPTGMQPGQIPAGLQQGLMPAPGRPVTTMPGMPTVAPGVPTLVPPTEPGVEVFGDEEFPEGSVPQGEIPEVPEDGGGE